MANKQPAGKGGNFETRRNVFQGLHVLRNTPSFTEVSNIASVLDAICKQGCAIMVGHTRDGGAVVLTVLDGEDRHRTYCSNDQELQEAFEQLNGMYAEG